MELFVFERTNEFILPTSYDRYDNGVNGIFTTSSIRFYKDAIENIITYESIKEKHPEKTSKEIRNMLRKFRSLLETFKVDSEGSVDMKVCGTKHKGKYKFYKGLILVKGEEFIDVTSKEHLHNYLSQYGFEETYEKEILKNNVTTLHRDESKGLTFKFE